MSRSSTHATTVSRWVPTGRYRGHRRRSCRGRRAARNSTATPAAAAVGWFPASAAWGSPNTRRPARTRSRTHASRGSAAPGPWTREGRSTETARRPTGTPPPPPPCCVRSPRGRRSPREVGHQDGLSSLTGGRSPAGRRCWSGARPQRSPDLSRIVPLRPHELGAALAQRGGEPLRGTAGSHHLVARVDQRGGDRPARHPVDPEHHRPHATALAHASRVVVTGCPVRTDSPIARPRRWSWAASASGYGPGPASRDPVPRLLQQRHERDLLVREPRADEGVAEHHLPLERDLVQVEPLDVLLVAGLPAFQRRRQDGRRVRQPHHPVLDEFAQAAAHHQSAGAQRVPRLRLREVVERAATVTEVQRRHRRGLRSGGGVARPARAGDRIGQGRGGGARDDTGRRGAHAEETPDQRRRVVRLRGGDLDRRHVPDEAVPHDPQPGGGVGEQQVLLGDLDAPARTHRVPQRPQSVEVRGRGRLGEDPRAVGDEVGDEGGRRRDGHRDEDEFR